MGRIGGYTWGLGGDAGAGSVVVGIIDVEVSLYEIDVEITVNEIDVVVEPPVVT